MDRIASFLGTLGPSDHEDLKAWLKDAKNSLRTNATNKSQQYSFDFEQELPRFGPDHRFRWAADAGTARPSYDRSTRSTIESLSLAESCEIPAIPTLYSPDDGESVQLGSPRPIDSA